MLDDAADFVRLQTAFYLHYDELFDQIPANTVMLPQRTPGGLTSQWSSVGRFDITADDAVIVTVKPAHAAGYQSFELANPWLQSLEFVHHQSSLNVKQARVDADGLVRHVVSLVDPAVPNWVDPVAHSHGVIFERWQKMAAVLTPDEHPSTHVVRLSQLRRALPADTPSVTPAERAQSLHRRALGVEARFERTDPSRPELERRIAQLRRVVAQPIPGLSRGE